MTEDGEPLSYNSFGSVVRQLERKSGVDFYSHKLRHTFVTMMAQQGTNVFDLKEMLGHTSITTTQIYIQGEIAKPYLFTVSGVNLLTLSYDNFQQALALPDEINHWAFLGGNCIALYFTLEASPGRYNFSLNLPDGRSAKVVFQYPTTQKVKLAAP